jgi:uncharacterized protein (DUF433 family)
MPIPRIPDDDARQVRAEYEADPSLSFERLADRWGWSASALCKAHKRAGGVPRPKGIEPRRIAVNDSVIMTLRQRGASYAQIAAQFSATPADVEAALQRARRAMRRRGQ